MIRECSTYEECVSFVKENTQYPVKKSDWVVFDMDDTLITDRYYTGINNPFSFMYKGIHHAIQPMVDLYNWCIDVGYSVCIITGRNKSLHNISIENLRRVGINHCDMFITKDCKDNVQDWKTRCRQEIDGNVIFNIGDRDTDLLGGCSTHTLQIPGR